MKKTAIIIPSRLDAQRLPNKPLELINNKEMILHVYEAALKSNAEEVYVCLLYTSPSPRDGRISRMPSSA